MSEHLRLPWSIVIDICALVAILVVLQDAFEVMLLPRRVQRRTRFAAIYFRTAWRACSRLSFRLRPDRGRAGLLSHFGALSMLGLFAAWAMSLILGFGVLEWGLQPVAKPPAGFSPLSEELYLSGVTFFTLGYGDVVPHSGLARFTSVVEAGVGLGFIAVVIGYLPLIHQLFSRREALVIQLDGRAGSPPTAAGLLCKHAEDLDELDDFLRSWEVWGAELLEGHLSYLMLAYYRSQHDNQSWLASLAAIIDCCALILVGVDGAKTFQARMTFRMMRQVAVEMARSFRIEPSRYDGGDRLSKEAGADLEAALAEAGLAWRADDEAFASLQALRATYEPLLEGLARFLLLTLPPWIPSDTAEDHWRSGHRGLLAFRMVEQLAKPQDPVLASKAADQSNIWRRLRMRLR